MADSPTSEARALLDELRSRAATAAVMSDVDGTLAPIVPRPGDAAISARAREALYGLSRHYALVACVSGRRALEARRIVGLDELHYIGNHGYELLEPGAATPRPHPALEDDPVAVIRFTSGVSLEPLRALGIETEDKDVIQAYHWRRSADPDGARERLVALAGEAEEAGLRSHWGRMVLELRPAVEIDKGTAIEELLGEDFEAALYAGDDRTDLDAFAALRRMAGSGRLRAALCVGVASAEGPPEIAEQAEITVDGVDGMVDLLESVGEV